jgi:putative redox protein
MKVELESFTVQVEGEMMDTHPKYYISMHIVYLFKGKDLPMDKLKRAVELSQETYCGVGATYKKALKLSYEIKVIG